MSLHIGTSGWDYPEWKPAFYPADLPRRAFLAHYAAALTGCEINATHYRLPSEAATARWAEATPGDFRFAAKAHRRLTHGRTLPPDDGGDEFLGRFLDALAPLGARLGIVLFQLPPSRDAGDTDFARFLDALPAGLPFAVEVRHPSGADAGLPGAVAAAGGTLCLGETDGEAPDELPPGPFAYVRLRAERYTADARERWAGLLARGGAGRPVFAFAKHKGVPADDPFTGVAMARWLLGNAA